MEIEEINGPYRATKVWTNLVHMFISGIPLKRHWRNFKLIENSFTGAEAVKWFHGLLVESPELCAPYNITRDKTIVLLEKFYEAGVFRCLLDSKENKFRGTSDIYVLSNEPYLQKLPLAPVNLNTVHTKSYSTEGLKPFSDYLYNLKSNENGVRSNVSHQQVQQGLSRSKSLEIMKSSELKKIKTDCNVPFLNPVSVQISQKENMCYPGNQQQLNGNKGRRIYYQELKNRRSQSSDFNAGNTGMGLRETQSLHCRRDTNINQLQTFPSTCIQERQPVCSVISGNYTSQGANASSRCGAVPNYHLLHGPVNSYPKTVVNAASTFQGNVHYRATKVDKAPNELPVRQPKVLSKSTCRRTQSVHNGVAQPIHASKFNPYQKYDDTKLKLQNQLECRSVQPPYGGQKWSQSGKQEFASGKNQLQSTTEANIIISQPPLGKHETTSIRSVRSNRSKSVADITSWQTSFEKLTSRRNNGSQVSPTVNTSDLVTQIPTSSIHEPSLNKHTRISYKSPNGSHGTSVEKHNLHESPTAIVPSLSSWKSTLQSCEPTDFSHQQSTALTSMDHSLPGKQTSVCSKFSEQNMLQKDNHYSPVLQSPTSLQDHLTQNARAQLQPSSPTEASARMEYGGNLAYKSTNSIGNILKNDKMHNRMCSRELKSKGTFNVTKDMRNQRQHSTFNEKFNQDPSSIPEGLPSQPSSSVLPKFHVYHANQNLQNTGSPTVPSTINYNFCSDNPKNFAQSLESTETFLTKGVLDANSKTTCHKTDSEQAQCLQDTILWNYIPTKNSEMGRPYRNNYYTSGMENNYIIKSNSHTRSNSLEVPMGRSSSTSLSHPRRSIHDEMPTRACTPQEKSTHIGMPPCLTSGETAVLNDCLHFDNSSGHQRTQKRKGLSSTRCLLEDITNQLPCPLPGASTVKSQVSQSLQDINSDQNINLATEILNDDYDDWNIAWKTVLQQRLKTLLHGPTDHLTVPLFTPARWILPNTSIENPHLSFLLENIYNHLQTLHGCGFPTYLVTSIVDYFTVTTPSYALSVDTYSFLYKGYLHMEHTNREKVQHSIKQDHLTRNHKSNFIQCYETAFTGESPITRVISHHSLDNLLPCNLRKWLVDETPTKSKSTSTLPFAKKNRGSTRSLSSIKRNKKLKENVSHENKENLQSIDYALAINSLHKLMACSHQDVFKTLNKQAKQNEMNGSTPVFNVCDSTWHFTCRDGSDDSEVLYICEEKSMSSSKKVTGNKRRSFDPAQKSGKVTTNVLEHIYANVDNEAGMGNNMSDGSDGYEAGESGSDVESFHTATSIISPDKLSEGSPSLNTECIQEMDWPSVQFFQLAMLCIEPCKRNHLQHLLLATRLLDQSQLHLNKEVMLLYKLLIPTEVDSALHEEVHQHMMSFMSLYYKHIFAIPSNLLQQVKSHALALMKGRSCGRQATVKAETATHTSTQVSTISENTPSVEVFLHMKNKGHLSTKRMPLGRNETSNVLIQNTVKSKEEPSHPKQETGSVRLFYCEQVSSQEFEHQHQTGSQLALSELLEQIINDCKMKEKEKKKRLKSFKDSYPHIYARRFPESSGKFSGHGANISQSIQVEV